MRARARGLAPLALLCAGVLSAGVPGARGARAAAPAVAAAPTPHAAPPLTPAAPAALDEVHREAAALFDLTGGEEMMGKMLDALRGQVIAIFAQHGKAPEDATRIFDEVLMPEFKARLSELRPAIVEIWAENFTIDDLRGLHAFYDTPLGRKVLERQPVVAQQAFAVGAVWGRRVAQDVVQRHMDELRRRGVKL